AGFSVDGTTPTAAQLNNPAGVAVDATGNLYMADTSNNRVRRVTPNGIINTIAGTGTAGFSGDGASPMAAQLNNPAGVAVDATGNLYIADTSNNRVRRVTPNGIISTIVGTGTAGSSGDGAPPMEAQLNNPVE